MRLYHTIKEDSRVNRHLTKWEKIFVSIHLTKGQYPEHISNSKTLITKPQINQFLKWSNDLNRLFSKEKNQQTYEGKKAQCH
jgi:hypothetical protein